MDGKKLYRDKAECWGEIEWLSSFTLEFLMRGPGLKQVCVCVCLCVCVCVCVCVCAAIVHQQHTRTK